METSEGESNSEQATYRPRAKDTRAMMIPTRTSCARVRYSGIDMSSCTLTEANSTELSTRSQ